MCVHREPQVDAGQQQWYHCSQAMMQQGNVCFEVSVKDVIVCVHR